MVEDCLIVFLSYKLTNLFDTKMDGQTIVMITVNQLRLNGLKYK